MDFVSQSHLAQQSAVSEANSPHSSQNRANSAPGTAGENLSMAAGKLSLGHVTTLVTCIRRTKRAFLQAAAPCGTRALSTQF